MPATTNKTVQPALFDTPPQPRVQRERPAIYWAVLKLRRDGMRVYRHGMSRHFLDGRIVSERELLEVARRHGAQV